MRILSNPVVQSVLLIFILTFYAVSLVRDVMILRRDDRTLKAGKTTNNRSLVYVKPTGIDISGRHFFPATSSADDSAWYVAFLLRTNSLAQDLDFWNRVARQLQNHKQIHLVGYCDDERCADRVRQMQTPMFPVISHSDPIDIQAVLNADAEGKAIRKRPPPIALSNIAWRGLNDTAEHTAQDLIK